jgi:hypothetical protein
MRATFITTALENGAQLEDVQKAAGHRDLRTTKGYNPGRRRRSSRPTDLSSARLRARRFDFVVSPEPPMLAAHHTIFWEMRA